jgi:hypothetical protein
MVISLKRKRILQLIDILESIFFEEEKFAPTIYSSIASGIVSALVSLSEMIVPLKIGIKIPP